MTRPKFVVVAGLVALVMAISAALIWHSRAAVGLSQPPTAASIAATAPAPNSGSASTPRGDVALDLRRQQLIGVRTVKATRRDLSGVIRATGTVRADESRVVDVNVKLDGWIRDLAADFTGRVVRQGDPLLTLYSPDLLATEREYLLALDARDQLQGSVMPDAKPRADALAAAARQRLALWDLPADDLRDLEATRQPKDAWTLRASSSGVVVDKSVVKGAHVTAGQTLFKIADLSVVWVEAEVHAPDLSQVSLGARATVILEAYPNERTTGRVIYLSPYVDEQTRTSTVRYEFANPRGRLKPGMFATVEIATSGGTGIVVPTDAVLDSGREQIVFVAEGDGYFTPRAVVVGRRMDDAVEIARGLHEGEEVASAAAFFLDSESQLRGAVEVFVPSAPSSGQGNSAEASAARLRIALHTDPDPAKTGENQFEATVADTAGAPVSDADVVVQLLMPAMPTMNMPAMRSEVKLASVGNGVYRGTGQLMVAGRWEATVTVTRTGQRLGSIQLPIVSR